MERTNQRDEQNNNHNNMIDKQDLLDILENAKNITNWELHLLSYEHKSNPDEFISYKFDFQGDDRKKETVNSKIQLCSNNVSKDGKIILRYTDGNTSKTTIEYIPDLNECLFNATFTNFKTAIESPDETCKLTNINPKAYVLYGTCNNGTCNIPVFLITKKNPIATFKRKGWGPLVLSERTIVESTDPQLSINGSFDAIIYGQQLYSINLNFEEIFNVHSTFIKNRDEIIDQIDSLKIIQDFNIFKDAAMTKQQARTFAAFDSTILTKPENLTIISDKGEINFKNDKFILNDKKTAQKLIKILCRKIALDFFTEDTVEVPSQSPITYIE
ncbi:MAG: Kiwa anti-phage protein KwaB-like domain-containing protein [Culicoidibacterales bacterium]